MSEPIFISDNGKRIEATGKTLDNILAERKAFDDYLTEVETQQQAKETHRKAALAKLAGLGLTADEIAAIVGA